MNYQKCFFSSLQTDCKSSSETQGQSVGSGEKARQKFLSKGGGAPGYLLSPDHFQKFKRMPAPDWAQIMLCIIVPNRRAHILSSFRVFVHDGYCLNHGLPGSCTKEMHAVRKLSVCIKSSSDFKVLSARKLETRFQKYKLQLILRKYIYRELLKDTVIIPTRLLCQMQANSSGAEFLSTISKFMKRINFVMACLRPSQNVKLDIFTGSRAVDGKEMYKKA